MSSHHKNINEKYLQGVSGADPECGARRDDGHAAAAQHHGREVYQEMESCPAKSVLMILFQYLYTLSISMTKSKH